MSRDANPEAGEAPDPEERELLRRLQAGDEEGLARLIDRYGEPLMQYLYSILRDREAAEDLFQDTWVRVARKIRGFDPERPFAPWLFRVARNGAYDRLRRSRKILPLDEPVLRTRADPAFDGTTAADRLAAGDLVARLLPRLEPNAREILHLRFFRECSYEEIAEICGIPLGTVKSRLRRALNQMGALHERMEARHDDTR
jgi:RNA polymerase sigma-70 factor (ECF subfamily)